MDTHVIGAGAWSETQDATESVQYHCNEVKCQVEEETNKKYGMFRAIEFRSQGVWKLMMGTNLLIKVHVGCDDYLHIQVFHSFFLKGKHCEVRYVEEGHHKCDPLIPKGIGSTSDSTA